MTPPPKKKKKKKKKRNSTNHHTPKSITFLKFLTNNNAPNLNIYMKIPPSPDSHCLGTPTTGRVSVCNISIQQTMFASAKFSNFRNRISNIFKCYPTKNIETPL